MNVRQSIICLVAVGLSAAVGAVDAPEIWTAFSKKRTESKKTYYGKELNVFGALTSMRQESLGYSLVIDNKVAVMIDRKNVELINQVKASIESTKDQEEQRVDQAKAWEKHYKSTYRLLGGRLNGKRMEKYDDAMNPHGSTDKERRIGISASGTCQGMRMGKVLIKPASTVLITPYGAGNSSGKPGGGAPPAVAAAQAANAMTEAAARTDWKLTGTIYVEFGNRYFGPDGNQYGVNVQSVPLPPNWGAFTFDEKLNNKKAVIEATLQAKAFGPGAVIVMPGSVKLKSVKLQ